MKKISKGLMVLSVGFLLAGCSCNKEVNNEQVQVENVYNTDHIFDDVSSSLSKLYNESVTSVVRVIANETLGSGVVYKEEGDYAYILTNAHVIADEKGNERTSIEVVFSNYARVTARTIAYDRNEDVAVISVNKNKNYTVAKLVEDDTDVKIGDSVYSIGNPNGSYFAVTTGVISNNRLKTSTKYISNDTTETYVYNSTSTINPGNSGGAMFNSDGEVIAINTMQPEDSKNEMRNHNYAIPANYFAKVADYLVVNRANHVRSTLGITVKSICDYSVSEKATLGIKLNGGVHIISTSVDGVTKGRVITHINGTPINTFEDYEFELLEYSKDDIVTLTISDTAGSNIKDVNVKMK